MFWGMKRLFCAKYAMFLLAAGMLAAPASLALPASSLAPVSASFMNKPLMVIRFNQSRVFYQKPLYTALSRAVQAEPAVKFVLVSYVPQTADAALNERWMASAGQHTAEVVAQMQQMGVPQSQISVNTEPDPSLSYDELHIFVR